MPGLTLEMCLSNWKSVVLTILKLLAFNTPAVWLTGSLHTQTDTQSD